MKEQHQSTMNELAVSFTDRRRKEDLAFMIIRFLKSFHIFRGIYQDFIRIIHEKRSFEGSNLFQRIKKLEEDNVFDIKEKAHFLFRKIEDSQSDTRIETTYESLKEVFGSNIHPETKTREAREILAAFRKAIVTRSIDSCVGTGFHLFMILRESLYQLEYYVPQYMEEHRLLDKIETLATDVGYLFSDVERHELLHLRQLDRLSQTITSDIKDHAKRAIEQCNSLFKETAEVLRHHMEESGTNEVLILNLLKERELVDSTYGADVLEDLFSEMLKTTDITGSSGIEKAINFVKEHSGNTSVIEQMEK